MPYMFAADNPAKRDGASGRDKYVIFCEVRTR